MSKLEITDSKRGDKAPFSDEVINIFAWVELDIYNKYYYEMDDEKSIELCFSNSSQGEGDEVFFHDSLFDVHERGFVKLCDVAKLEPNSESSQLRVRYGFNPSLSYFHDDSL